MADVPAAEREPGDRELELHGYVGRADTIAAGAERRSRRGGEGIVEGGA